MNSLLRMSLNRAALPAARASSTQTEYTRPEIQDFWTKNEKLNRPMSPHLTIYARQLTSTLSILHRISGSGLGVAFYVGAIGYGLASTSSADIALALHSMPAPILYSGKFLLASAFMFKNLAGLRHLVWDTGASLTLRGVYASGYLTIAGTVVSALALTLLV